MAYNVAQLDSKLKEYLDGNRTQVLTDILFDKSSLEHFTLQTEVKASTPIILIDQAVEFQDLDCNFNASGDTTLTDRLLVPSFIKVENEYCDRDFLKSFAAHQVKLEAGLVKEDMPFEEYIFSQLVAKINQKKESALWNGTKVTDKIDGIATIITKEIASGVIPDANVVAKGSDNMMTRVEKLWKQLPAKLGDAEFYMSVSNFKQLILEYSKANMYNYTAKEDGTYEITLPYSNNKVFGINGLTDDMIIATNKGNFYYGVDGTDSGDEEVDVWYSKDNQKFRSHVAFGISCQIAIPSNVFVNTTKA